MDKIKEIFDDIYVTRNGSVFSVIKYMSGDEKVKQRKLSETSLGYLTTKISGTTYYVHRLVAEAFIPNPDGKEEVDHIDTNRSNNMVSNLRWVSKKENHANKISRVLHRLANIENQKGRRVYKYNKYHQLVDVYPSVKECCVNENINYYYMSNYLNHMSPKVLNKTDCIYSLKRLDDELPIEKNDMVM